MDFLPEVKMDFIPSDDEENIESVVDEIEDFDEEKDLVQEEEVQEEVHVVEAIPKAKSKREDMNVDEIFSLPEDNTIVKTKLTKSGKPRKKRAPMTEEHKEKLKLARKKAMASRKKKAQERKENKALEIEEKELLKKQKLKRVKKLKEEVEENEKEKVFKEIKKEPTFTKKDLEEAQLQAIMSYEKIRKTRKEEKKIKQKKEEEEEMLKKQLRRAVAPPQQEYNPFMNCY